MELYDFNTRGFRNSLRQTPACGTGSPYPTKSTFVTKFYYRTKFNVAVTIVFLMQNEPEGEQSGHAGD